MLVEGSFPIIGAVTSEFLVKMNHDGSSPSLHALEADNPLEDLSKRYPEKFARLKELAIGTHETSRYLLYNNVRK